MLTLKEGLIPFSNGLQGRVDRHASFSFHRMNIGNSLAVFLSSADHHSLPIDTSHVIYQSNDERDFMRPIEIDFGYWVVQVVVNAPLLIVLLVGLFACLRRGAASTSATRVFLIAAMLQFVLVGLWLVSPLVLNRFAQGDPARISPDIVTINNIILHFLEAMILSLCLWTLLGTSHNLPPIDTGDELVSDRA